MAGVAKTRTECAAECLGRATTPSQEAEKQVLHRGPGLGGPPWCMYAADRRPDTCSQGRTSGWERVRVACGASSKRIKNGATAPGRPGWKPGVWPWVPSFECG